MNFYVGIGLPEIVAWKAKVISFKHEITRRI